MADYWPCLGKAGRSVSLRHLASGPPAGSQEAPHPSTQPARARPHQPADRAVIAVICRGRLEALPAVLRRAAHPRRQRHVMYGAEFDVVMADSKVTSSWPSARTVRCRAQHDDRRPAGGAAGLAGVLRQPLAGALPRGRIYYIGFLAVHPDSHGTGVFGEMVKVMTERGRRWSTGSRSSTSAPTTRTVCTCRAPSTRWPRPGPRR